MVKILKMMFVGVLALPFSGCAKQANHLSRPNATVILGNGDLIISDLLHDRLVHFNKKGRFLGTWASSGLGKGKLWHVTAMTSDGADGVWVANRRPDGLDADTHHTELKHFVNGKEVSSAELTGALASQAVVSGLVRMPNGNLIVSGDVSTDLVVVDEAGNRQGRYGGLPPTDLLPTFLAADDHLWIVEQPAHRIRQVFPDGQLKPVSLDATVGMPRFPASLAICQEQQWFAIADLGGFQIRRYHLDGSRFDRFKPKPVTKDAPVQLMDVDISKDCSQLVITDSKGNRVLVTDTKGEVLHTIDSW